MSSPKGHADLLRERASELQKLAEQIEAGHQSSHDLERRLELVNAEAEKARSQFYEQDRQTTRLRQAEANLSQAMEMLKKGEDAKARQVETTRAALEAFNERNGLRGTVR
jgi:hypothetical protein